MAALILPSRWTQQPQGSIELDPAHWLTKAITHCVVFSLPTDLAKRTSLPSAGSPTSVATSGGISFRNTSVSDYYAFSNSAANPAKALVLAVGSVDAGATTGFFASRNFNGANVALALWGRFAGLGVNLGFGFYDGTAWRNASGADIRGTGTRNICGSYDGATVRLHLDGKLEASTAFSGSLPSSANSIDIGRYQNDGVGMNGTLSMLCIVDGDVLRISEQIGNELTQNPWQIFRPLVRRIYFDLGAGGGTPNISPSGIASVEAFGSATVSRSSVQSIAATGIASAETFGGATVARTSVQAVSATGITSEEAFGAATVARTSVQSVTTTGIASAEAFGTATVTRSSVQAVAPSGIASAEAFGTATVTRSSVQAVAPTGIASAEAFGTHTITPGGVVVPQGIPSAEAFGTATLTRTSVQSVSATGIASGEAFGSATVTRTSAQSIVVSGIASGEVFGSAAFTRIGQGVVAPQGIASAEAFGTAAITRTSVHTITPSGISSGEVFGTANVSVPGDRTLTAQDLVDIARVVWAHPKALTVAKFLGLK